MAQEKRDDEQNEMAGSSPYKAHHTTQTTRYTSQATGITLHKS